MSYAYGEALSDTSKLYGRDSVDLLARMIYAEAENQSWDGKAACAHVAKNRKADGRFGGNTYEAVLLCRTPAVQFVGMWTTRALRPTLSSTAWNDSLAIALNMATVTNPIGNRLYFGVSAPSGAKDVLTIGGHKFFNM